MNNDALGLWINKDGTVGQADPSAVDTGGMAALWDRFTNGWQQVTDGTAVNRFQNGLDYVGQWWYSKDSDWFFNPIADSTNGFADKVTLGGMAKFRQLAGTEDTVNMNSDAYRYGGYAGQAVNIGLMLANPLAAGQSATGFFSLAVRSGGWTTAYNAVSYAGALSSAWDAARRWARGIGKPRRCWERVVY